MRSEKNKTLSEGLQTVTEFLSSTDYLLNYRQLEKGSS